MHGSIIIQTQLLATKSFVPVATGTLICRPRLMALLNESLKHPLTLVCAPAGFGKTMLLSSWAHALKTSTSVVAWVSLDQEDNDPQLFWTYVLSALSTQRPERFTWLFKYLQSPEVPSLESVLTALINLLLESPEHVVLILDDYHMISEQQVHSTLSYLVERMSAHFHIIVATRTDPPLPLSRLRARRHLQEIGTDQLRCTAEEAMDFFDKRMGVSLPLRTIQEVTLRTEGWLVGLQLLGLSLREHPDPLALLEEVSGKQRYIVDYLTEVVLHQQSQEVQTFLLCTSVLERLTASLCDAVLQQQNSQQMLHQLEQANLFVVSLDSKRQWYRYHALFAEALSSQLEQTQPDLLLSLHSRASCWYAEHDQPTQAIVHAFRAKAWSWVAELIEQQSAALNTLTWGISKQKALLLRDWLEQIPVEILHARPRLCLSCTWMALCITPQTVVETRLNAVERLLTTELMGLSHKAGPSAISLASGRQELEDLLGETIAYRALMRSYEGDGEVALALCQQAQSLLSVDNGSVPGHIAAAKLIAWYASSANDATAAIQEGLHGASLSEAAGYADQAISLLGLTALHLIGTGRLHQTQQVTRHAIELGRKPEGFVLPAVSWSMLWQAEVLREWNELESARALIEQAIELCDQLESPLLPMVASSGYAMLLRVCLSRGELDEAHAAGQEFKHLSSTMNQPHRLYYRSFFTTVDQVRLWLVCGQLDRATRWVEEQDLGRRHGTPFTREREEVACARVLLAQQQPDLVLQRLSAVLQRACKGQRWGHVIELSILQALAYQMSHQQKQALESLLQAVRLAEPEGFLRSFVDEGAPMKRLLSQLRQEQGQDGPMPYLGTVLAAFPSQSTVQRCQSKRARPRCIRAQGY